MGDYGKGQVLGAAVSLPATSAAGFFLINGSHPLLIAGMIIVGLIAFVSASAYMTRFLKNR